MAKLFISYSRTSLNLAEQLTADAIKLGHSVWYDRELSGGQSWWDAILDQIIGCDAFLLLVDQNSLQSEACAEEWRYALTLRRSVIPVLPVATTTPTLPRAGAANLNTA